jgi:xylulokinase
MALLLGIDLGTSYFKVGVFDSTGEMQGLGRVPVVTQTPAPGHCELSLDDFWSALRAGLTEALRQARATAADIVGVSYSSQASTFLILDENAVPLTPLVMWTDTRAEPTHEAIAFAQGETFQRTVGFEGLSRFSAVAKWQWFARNVPEVWSRAAMIMTLSDYFTYALTGERVGDASTAAFLGIYDLRRSDWWPDALQAFGLSRTQFSRPRCAGQMAGRTSARAMALLGLPEGIPFAVGALDHHAAALGSGLGSLADLSISTGTVLAAILLVDTVEPVADCYHGPHVDGRTFYRLAFDPDGAGRLEDFQRNHGAGRSIEELLALAAMVPNEECQPSASSGTPSDYETGKAVRAILEHVSATHLRLVERVAGARDIRTVVATGGGARSPLWLQITASTLKRPVVTPTCLERACLGAAAFAAVAAGVYPSLNAALTTMVHRGRVFEPQS